ncbi:hypothetical protein DH2020_041467 [Rehmannia glutinosa]|uniref:Phosphatidate cytidylyltransferase n=1 Tax=Rehmannia glutinosa TaxID=99300 RepID=A0ABR0UR23_REHGL
MASELFHLRRRVHEDKRLPGFWLINWYFFFTAMLYVYGRILSQHLVNTVTSDKFFYRLVNGLIKYHMVICYFLYIAGMMWFILTLKKKMYKYQFGQYAWTHMILIVVFTQSSFTVPNIFEGIFWFVLPASLIAINDVAAYFFGFFFGKTPLIKLSPKKTWEGFIGGSVATVVSAFLNSALISRGGARGGFRGGPRRGSRGGNRGALRGGPTSRGSRTSESAEVECFYCHEFGHTKYNCPQLAAKNRKGSSSPIPPLPLDMVTISSEEYAKLIEIVNPQPPVFADTFPWKGISVSPVQWHALCLGLFASIIAPFGGFFASGLKRAFKIKDFGDSIPGHGGFTDRMDCQMVMAIFAYIYFQSFILPQTNSVEMILDQIVRNLGFKEQERLYMMLGQIFKEEKFGNP